MLFSYKNKFNFHFSCIISFFRIVTISKEKLHMSVHFLYIQKSTKLEFLVPCFLLVFHSNKLTLSTIRFLCDVTHHKLEFFCSSFFREFCDTLIIFINNLLYFFLISHLTFPPIVVSYIAVEVPAEYYQHQNVLRIYYFDNL